MIPEQDADQAKIPVSKPKMNANPEVFFVGSVHIGFNKYAFSDEAVAGAVVRHRVQGYVTSLRKPTWRRSQDLAARDATGGRSQEQPAIKADEWADGASRQHVGVSVQCG